MLLTREFDAKMIKLQRQGAITFTLSCLGEEGCVTASAAALEQSDWMYPQYREPSIFFWRGGTVQQFVDQMFGNANDLLFGRQMPNHFGSKELNIVTVSSPIATQIPHAAGCGYAMKVQKEKNVTICYFGEGSTSEGDFHAGLNFAAVTKAPVIFFCRNNQYAISTPAECQFASEGVAPKGIGYGVETYRVDGNDVFAVHEVVTMARKTCLKGKGPVLIEAMTYRMGGHSTSDDPTRYRDEKELKEWEKKDPIARLCLYLEKNKLWDKKKEEAELQRIKNEINEAVKKAKSTPKPSLHTLFEHVYFEVPEKLEQQYRELKTFFPEE